MIGSESEVYLDYEEILMVKAAWYYYHEEMTQQQISELLGINRMRVIKLLDKAKKLGVIQFRFRHDSEKRMEAEQLMKKEYGLGDCFIVPSPTDPENTNENVARAASMYVCNRISGETFINIGYGDTCSRVLNHLAISSEHTLSCVSLTGGVSYYLPKASSGIFNSRLYLMPAPILASSLEVADAMKAEKSVQEIQALIPLSSLSVVSVGSLDAQATLIKTGVLTSNDFLVLRRNGAVGDILSHFIDKDGKPISTDLEARLISTPLETVHSLKNVIGVAAGKGKVDALRAVLHAGYLDVLITDEDTAEELLR